MRLSALLLLLSACGSDPLTVVTYNAGLAEGFVVGASERENVTAAAAVALDADILCVQEVWQPHHIAAFKAAAEADYPNSVFMDDAPDPGTEAACEGEDLTPLFDCYETNCADGCIDDTADCLLQNCAVPILSLSNQCIGCLEANVGDPTNAQATCETEDTKYAYNGAFGIGILTGHPILSSETITLDSTTNRRGTIHAVVDAPGGEVDVFCTHLTADLTPLPYSGPEEDWIAEQATQIGTLTAWVEAQRGDGLAIWMGDFNTGPEGASYSAEIAENYDALTAISWDEPYVDSATPCTYCPDENDLINSSTNGVVIDHVFVTGADEPVYTATRVLDANIELPSCGTTMQGPPSDHYGVQVVIEQ